MPITVNFIHFGDFLCVLTEFRADLWVKIQHIVLISPNKPTPVCRKCQNFGLKIANSEKMLLFLCKMTTERRFLGRVFVIVGEYV